MLKSDYFAIKVSIVGSIGGLLFGYDLGVISQALPLLKDEFLMTINQQELCASLLTIGAVVGSLFGGYMCDLIGRKKTIYFTSIIFIIGSLLLSLSANLIQLYIGRFIVGIGVAISAIADVSYLTEISPEKHRGFCVGTNELMITIGLLFAFFIDYLLSKQVNGWRIMFAIPIIISTIWCILMLPMPESPKWLLVQGQESQALLVYIARTDTHSEAEVEFEQDKQEVIETKKANELPIKEVILFWKYPLIISITLMIAQNLSSHAGMLYVCYTYYYVAV